MKRHKFDENIAGIIFASIILIVGISILIVASIAVFGWVTVLIALGVILAIIILSILGGFFL